MPTQVRELVVFMASPGDLQDERSALRYVEDELNNTFEASGVRVRVVGWEQTTPGYGRPQARINPMVASCDIFIGLLNRRWGSDTGEFSSGFEEEFELALARRTSGDAPEIGMFFARLPQEVTADPGRQLIKVLAFKDRIQQERLVLYREFRSADNLATQALTFLTSHILNLLPGNTGEGRSQNPSGTFKSDVNLEEITTAQNSSDDAEKHLDDTTPALRQISETLRSFDTMIKNRKFEKSMDTDRLALIARSFERPHQPMGSHLINRLYRRRDNLELTGLEVDLWLRSFFQDIAACNTSAQRTVPGWDIIRTNILSSEDFDKVLAEFSGDTEPLVARGAVRVMTEFARRPSELWSTQDATPSDEMQPFSDSATALWIKVFEALPGQDAAFDYLVSQSAHTSESMLMKLANDERLDSLSREFIKALHAAQLGDFTKLGVLAPSSYHQDAANVNYLLEQNMAVIDSNEVDTIARTGSASLRRSAIRRQLSKDDLDERIIENILTWDDPESSQALLDRAKRDHTLGERMLSVVSKESSKYPSGIEAKLLGLLRSRDELKAMITASPFADDAWRALASVAPAEMIDEIREVLDTNAESVRKRLQIFTEKHVNLAPFILAKYRAAACFAISLNESTPVEDVRRVAREVALQDQFSQSEALLCLSRIVSNDLLPEIDEILGQVDNYGSIAHLPELLRSPMAEILARRWAVSEISSLQDAAEKWLIGQPERSVDELTSALYEVKSELRMSAVQSLLEKLDRSQAQDLLLSYPTTGRYWYNVIAALDEHLFAPHHDPSSNRFQFPE